MRQRIDVEKGLLRTFGRFMPLSVVVAVTVTIPSSAGGDTVQMVTRWAAVVALVRP